MSLIPSSVDNLDTYEPTGLELAPSYWTPQEPGETRRAFFMGITTRAFPDQNEPDQHVELPCAMFCSKVNGVVQVFANASKRLLGVMESQEEGKPFQITYVGKKQNSTNQKESDGWSIIPLKAKDK